MTTLCEKIKKINPFKKSSILSCYSCGKEGNLVVITERNNEYKVYVFCNNCEPIQSIKESNIQKYHIYPNIESIKKELKIKNFSLKNFPPYVIKTLEKIVNTYHHYHSD